MIHIENSQYSTLESFIEDVFYEQAKAYFDQLPEEKEETIALAAYEDEQLVGALVAHHKHQHLNLKYLTVANHIQGKGIGMKLVHELERLAQQRDIINITLQTRSYQAAGFYEKCGYTLYATLDDMPMRGVSRHYFVKKMK